MGYPNQHDQVDQQFVTGERVHHARRGWATFLLHDTLDTDTSEVLLDDGEATRITTAWLSRVGPGGEDPPPVPAAALAEFKMYGLTLPT